MLSLPVFLSEQLILRETNNKFDEKRLTSCMESSHLYSLSKGNLIHFFSLFQCMLCSKFCLFFSLSNTFICRLILLGVEHFVIHAIGVHFILKKNKG